MATKKKSATKVIGPKQIDASEKLVEKARVPFAAATRLKKGERKRTAKPRRGALGMLPQLATLYTKLGCELPGVDVQTMLSKASYAQRLATLLGVIAKLNDAVKDEYIVSSGAAWTTATTMYTALKRVSRNEEDVASELASIEAFFRKPRRPKQDAATAEGPKAEAPKADVSKAATA